MSPTYSNKCFIIINLVSYSRHDQKPGFYAKRLYFHIHSRFVGSFSRQRTERNRLTLRRPRLDFLISGFSIRDIEISLHGTCREWKPRAGTASAASRNQPRRLVYRQSISNVKHKVSPHATAYASGKMPLSSVISAARACSIGPRLVT